MNQDYLDQMQAHVDAGGKLTHQDVVELVEEVRRYASSLPPLERYSLETLLDRLAPP